MLAKRILRIVGSPITTVLLMVGLGFALLTAAPNLATVHLPGNQVGYEPVQPIAFSHRLHAGELQVQCDDEFSGGRTAFGFIGPQGR